MVETNIYKLQAKDHQGAMKDKDLDMKDKDLDMKDKDLDMKDKDLVGLSAQSVYKSSTVPF